MPTLIESANTLDLVQALRCYGFLAVVPENAGRQLERAGVWWPECTTPLADALDQANLIISTSAECFANIGVRVRQEMPGETLFESRRGLFWTRRHSVYAPLLQYLSFEGDNLEPLWATASGRSVLARWHRGGRAIHLLGLDFAGELLRRKQGDPAQVERVVDKSCFGFAFERANYLFVNQLVAGHETIAWADRLGFTVVRLLAQATGWPLAALLPDAARGLVLLTGDDDEAALELYAEQLEQVGTFPITYYLLPRTHHTNRTLAELPRSVELGLHVDALDHPRDYARICANQAAAVRDLTDRPVRSIRNHGFLNDGYLGHMSSWQHSALPFDVNYAGLDGTALTGSFLPFRARQSDGSWTDHFSLLTAFGDGMHFIHNWSQRQACRRIEVVAAQIEHEDPGVLVFNMHPGNIRITPKLHRTIMCLGRRPGWLALGAETYRQWLERWHQLELTRNGDNWLLKSAASLPRLALLWPRAGGWGVHHITANPGTQQVVRPAQAA
jgi:hypothetical protein